MWLLLVKVWWKCIHRDKTIHSSCISCISFTVVKHHVFVLHNHVLLLHIFGANFWDWCINHVRHHLSFQPKKNLLTVLQSQQVRFSCGFQGFKNFKNSISSCQFRRKVWYYLVKSSQHPTFGLWRSAWIGTCSFFVTDTFSSLTAGFSIKYTADMCEQTHKQTNKPNLLWKWWYFVADDWYCW